MTKSRKPIIGITMDTGYDDSFSPYPWYAIRENYVQYIAECGAVPILLPHHVEHAEHYANLIDGLLISGGDFDIPPHYWQEKTQSDTVKVKEKRTAFEMAMAKHVFALDKPMLGICGGQQLINVLCGGSLIQHIPDTVENCLNHSQTLPRHQCSHAANIIAGTLLRDIVQQEDITVNSSHHQSVAKVGAGLVVNAVAPDGVIEGIEHPQKRFVLGVQWHPEYVITESDRLIAKRFIAHANG